MATMLQINVTSYDILYSYALATGNPRNMKPWEQLPEWQRRFVLQAADYLYNTDNKAPAMHTNWYNALVAEGWTKGPVYDPVKKETPILVTWEELPDDLKLYEIFYATAFNGMKEKVNPLGANATHWEAVKVGDLMQRAYDAFHMERSDTYFTRLWEKTNKDIDNIRDFLLDSTLEKIKKTYGMTQ